MSNPSHNRSFQSQVIDPFLSCISRFSKRNAFCIDEAHYSYEQLGQTISKIRLALAGLPGHEVHIGLVANDDIETYASIFALWLEGKAYIPLHPNQPLDRCEEIIRQIDIRTILDSRGPSRFQGPCVILTNDLVFLEDCLLPNPDIDEEELAYVLFTSGSTGSPKGVTLSRKNIGTFMDSFVDAGIQINDEDRCLQCFDLTFDVSVQCYLMPLISGACVYTVPHDQIKYGYVFGLLEDHKLSFAAVAPSMLRYLRPYFAEINLPELKYCILTGEASPEELAKEWQECAPNARLFNFYGPTETTIYCTYYAINKKEGIKSLYGMLSIGKPMKNVSAIVIDEELNILKQGEKGELCISGDQVSPGYWKNPEKNTQSFFEKDFDGQLRRFYHTGDLCFIDHDENIMLFGRQDSQVKIQGYRVELGEIEFHARDFLKGKNAVVVTFVNQVGNTELALFAEGENIDTTSLVTYMKTKMPFYMIPTKIMTEPEFPLNSNGKVHRMKLKEKIN